jgi:hypothetical protein
MDKRWISVEVSDGLFPSERTVQFKTTDGEVEVFVPLKQIDGNKLTVDLLDQDTKFSLVQVPSQGGMTVAKVNNKAILTKPK